MDFMIRIAKEKVGVTGYKTIEIIETLRRDDAIRKLDGAIIKRRFACPFNASIEIVVIE